MSNITVTADHQTKGLLRQVLAGAQGSLRAVFSNLAQEGQPHERLVNTRWNVTYTKIDLPAEDGSGCWKLFSVSDEIFMVVTDCHYTKPRVEHVPAEGLVEFHYVLEGPVALEIPRPTAPEISATTMMVCHAAPDVPYKVTCLPGTFRMVSVYVQPKMLSESFGFRGTGSNIAQNILHPNPESIVMVEAMTNVRLVDALREVFQLDFSHESHLMMAVGRIFEILGRSAIVLEENDKRSSKGVALSSKELALFDKVRVWLTDEDEGEMTIADLAKRAGTNSTKLKSGFKLLYGMTIFEYRHRYRMDKAIEMLKDPSYQIANIATRLGYKHQASFTAACKDHFGTSPKDLRKKLLMQLKEA